MEVNTLGSPPGRDCAPLFPLQHATQTVNVLSSAPNLGLPSPLPEKMSEELGTCVRG